MFLGLREGYGDATLPYRIVARWVKVFREGREAVQDNLLTGRPHVENNTVQLLAFLSDADRLWTAREVAAKVEVCGKTVFHILHDILGYHKLAAHWYPMIFPRCKNGIAVQSQGPCWTDTKRNVETFVEESSLWTKPGLAHTNQTWNANQINGSIPVLLVQRKCNLHKCCQGDVNLGAWHSWGNTLSRCTSKADGKRCLLLHVPPATPLSRAQENTTTLGGTEHHHSSWQCKEPHRCCCHGSLAPLAMGVSGTFTILTRYESMRLPSLRQSERTSASDPVQHKRWTYPCYRVVSTEHQQRWTRCMGGSPGDVSENSVT